MSRNSVILSVSVIHCRQIWHYTTVHAQHICFTRQSSTCTGNKL